ncbi:PLP-dependent aminotransferase family protein [Aquabacterium sp.]|uniref:MocR-like pyridoxine biosynthesis transcription factor PdxR n=1 Tax=Aquabacterium sp. TaxID=1872578 RepID=UPI003784B7F0
MAVSGTNSRRPPALLDVPLLDRPPGTAAPGNQAARVHAALREAILGGRLMAGARLPASRTLSQQLGVSRNAVVAAFEALQGDGLVQARVGAGTYVATRLPARAVAVPALRKAASKAPAAPPRPPQQPFALGVPAVDKLLLQRLAGALRRQVTRAEVDALGYGDPRGSEALRQQLAAHLAASRGIVCEADSLLITSGVQQALRLCAQALLQPGDGVWVEDPGYPVARRTLAAAGLKLRPVPVDAEGIDVAAGLRRHRAARAAYVTPSHQFPMGVTMSMARRLALLEWAREHQAWVLEDDYDSEFRYAGPPLTALAGIDGPERVIYIGTFSKTLFPSLRLAYLVLPAAARERVIAARANFDRFGPRLLEDAVATLLADGNFAAHLRRARKQCLAARDRLAATLQHAAGNALRVERPTQGLHLLATLPAGLPADAGARIREAAGVHAVLLSETRLVPRSGEAFVLGFSGHALPAVEAAAQALGRAARQYLAQQPRRSGRRAMPVR